MAKITVYRYQVFDRVTETYVEPTLPWYAPLEKIKANGSRVVAIDAVEIDDSQLNRLGYYDPSGLTKR